MKNRSAALTLWANRLLMVTVVMLAFGMPAVLRWYNHIRILNDNQNLALLIAFYLCVPIALFALYNLEQLLRSISLPAAFFYAPLVFFCIVMAFLCPVVNVVRYVFDAAVTIREENDLTI